MHACMHVEMHALQNKTSHPDVAETNCSSPGEINILVAFGWTTTKSNTSLGRPSVRKEPTTVPRRRWVYWRTVAMTTQVQFSLSAASTNTQGIILLIHSPQTAGLRRTGPVPTMMHPIASLGEGCAAPIVGKKLLHGKSTGCRRSVDRFNSGTEEASVFA